MTYELISNFKDNKHFNSDFMTLIKKNDNKATFESWMIKSRQDDNFVPFGLVDDKNSLIACVGVFRTHLFVDNVKHDSIQIGKIFVRDSEENPTLIKNELLSKIVDKFEAIVDAIYTFIDERSYANHSLPELGFQKSGDYDCVLDWNRTSDKALALVVKKINVEDAKEFEKLLSSIKHSSRMSHSVATSGDSSIKMYNILKKYPRNVFHVPSLETTIVFTIQDEIFNLIAAFSDQSVDLEDLLKVVVPGHIEKVEFGFVPEIEQVKFVPKTEEEKQNESSFWVKPCAIKFNREKIIVPTLARTK